MYFVPKIIFIEQVRVTITIIDRIYWNDVLRETKFATIPKISSYLCLFSLIYLPRPPPSNVDVTSNIIEDVITVLITLTEGVGEGGRGFEWASAFVSAYLSMIVCIFHYVAVFAHVYYAIYILIWNTYGMYIWMCNFLGSRYGFGQEGFVATDHA